MKSFTKIKNSLKRIFQGRKERFIFTISFLVFFVLYSFVLPATYTGGRVGFVSLRLLNLKLFFFAFSFALLLSLILTAQIYSALKIKPIVKKKGFFGFISSLIPPLICCSPLLPTLFALFSGFLPFFLPFGGFLQGFIGAYEGWILSIILLFLGYQVCKALNKI